MLLVVMASTAAATATGLVPELNVFDPTLFRETGAQLFTGRWLDVFANKDVQIGPLQVLFFALVGAADRVLPLSYEMTMSLIVQIPLAVAMTIAARALIGSSPFTRDETRLGVGELVAGLGAVALGLWWTAFQTSQVGEAVVPLLWVFAAVAAARGRGLVAGALLGAGAAFKLWAVLGLPLLLLGRDYRRAAGGAGVAVGVAALLWGPFLAFGDVGILDYKWPLWPDAALRFLDPDGTYFTWPMRAVQAVAVVAVGTIAALWMRHRAVAVWVLPLVLACTKVLLDPVFWYWYWLPIDVFVLLAAAGIAALAQGPMRVLGPAVLGAVLFLPPGNKIVGVALLGAAFTAPLFLRHSPRRRSIA